MWLTQLLVVVCLIFGKGYTQRTNPTRAPATRPTLITTEPPSTDPSTDSSVIPQGGCLRELLDAPIIQSERRFLVTTKPGGNRRNLLKKFPATLVSPNTTLISQADSNPEDLHSDLPVAVVGVTGAANKVNPSAPYRSMQPPKPSLNSTVATILGGFSFNVP